MGTVIDISKSLLFRGCKTEDINICIADLSDPEYLELSKYYSDNRKWTKTQKNNYIEALFYGFLMPELFIYEKPNGDKYIIDGYNRLRTIIEFLNDEVSVPTKSMFKWHIKSTKYSKMSEELKSKFDNILVKINKITRIQSEDNLKHLYISLNK